jgi:hypothetical protein
MVADLVRGCRAQPIDDGRYLPLAPQQLLDLIRQRYGNQIPLADPDVLHRGTPLVSWLSCVK